MIMCTLGSSWVELSNSRKRASLSRTTLSLRAAALAAVVALSMPVENRAQVLKGQILGTITDQSGALVPGVKVTITDTRTNTQRTGDTNEAGNYFFVNLDPGY